MDAEGSACVVVEGSGRTGLPFIWMVVWDARREIVGVADGDAGAARTPDKCFAAFFSLSPFPSRSLVSSAEIGRAHV